MNEISSKTANVAELPLKLDLQLFAGEEEGFPALEETPEFKDDAKEFNAKMDKFVQERETKAPAEQTTENEPAQEEDKAGTPEVAVPDQKPKQDSETNKAFQEMRKAREDAERKVAEAEARAKKADELIAQQYGKSHGIYTVEQYEHRLQQEREAEENERYEAAGLKPEEIEKIRKFDELQRETESQKQERQRAEHIQQWDRLYTSYPELRETAKAFNEGKEPEWYTDEMKAELARGSSPLAAYRNAHFETILQRATTSTKEVAKQEALNQINSKDHIKANGTAGGDVDHVEIDDDTMRMYRALNKGKTDAQIRAWHKKNAM